MSRLPNVSLRVRLLSLVLLSVVPLLGLVLFNAAQQRQHDLAAASQRAQTAASLAALNISLRLQGQRQLLTTLAALPAVASGDSAGCTSAVTTVDSNFALYTNIGAARPNGDIFCSAIVLSQTTNISQRTWFQDAIASGGFALGDYQFSTTTGRPVIVGAYPVRAAGGALQAVVFASMDLTQFNALAQGASLPDNSTVVIIDETGTILSRYPDPANWVGQRLPDTPLVQAALSQSSGSAQLAGLDGVERLYGLAAVSEPVPGLHVAVGLPLDQAYAEVNAGLARSLIGLALVTVVVLAVARLAADGFVLNPVASLLAATRRFAAGDVAARSGGPYQAGELDDLAAAFDGMAVAIQQREAELDVNNRILKTLNECNQALVRSTDEPGLLDAICRNIVTFGQYRLAWVDLAGAQADQPMRAVALASAAPGPVAALPQTGGPSGAAIQTGQLYVMRVTDPATPAAWRAHGQGAGYQVIIALPMLQDGQTLGVLCIASASAAGFEASETQLLTELSGDLAYGLTTLRTRAARAQAEGQLAQNARRWRALAELDQKLGGAVPSYQALLDELAARTSELIGDATVVSLLSDDGQQLTQVALHHPNPEAKAILQTLLSSDPRRITGQSVAQVVTTGEAVLIPVVPQDELRAAVPASFQAYLDRYGLHSLLIVAMRAQGKVIGTLIAARGAAGRPYSEDERDFLQSIGDQAALAIANAGLYDQLQTANADLERRVAERTAALQLEVVERRRAQDHAQALNESLSQRAAELEVANRELEAFSYSVSHDLRAPLRSIDGFSLALLEDYAPQLPSPAQGYLKRVRAAAQRMAALIDDLLNLSRVTRSELHLEPVDLSLQAKSVAAELSRQEPGREVDFMIAPGLVTYGDSRLLGLVLSNLLGNAWKFTSRRDHAQIEFGADDGQDRPVFFVRDNGAGFDMAYVQRLFGAFQRLHDQNEYPGNGIGLATVQRVIHRHGGQVWAEGQPERGATFFFTIGNRHDRENHSAG